MREEGLIQKKIYYPSTEHINFTDLPIIINPLVGKAIGLVGGEDGLEILLKSSAEMIKFFNLDD